MLKFFNETPLLRVKNLSKSFGKNHVLRDISISIREGESVSILGKSGVGKSVFFKCLIGLLLPDSGQVYFRNKEIYDKTQLRVHCAYLFQEPALFDSMNIFDNIAFPLREVRKIKDKAYIRNKVAELLGWVGLEEAGLQMPHELSGGMQKRASFARTLAMSPTILLCDEPTTGLDPVTGDKIIKLIHKSNKELNITCITITHNLQQSLLHSDRIVMLNNGAFEVVDIPDNFLKSNNNSVQSFITLSSLRI